VSFLYFIERKWCTCGIRSHADYFYNPDSSILCDQPCIGNLSQKCGGKSSYSLYNIGFLIRNGTLVRNEKINEI
jgi:hypothetical protein